VEACHRPKAAPAAIMARISRPAIRGGGTILRWITGGFPRRWITILGEDAVVFIAGDGIDGWSVAGAGPRLFPCLGSRSEQSRDYAATDRKIAYRTKDLGKACDEVRRAGKADQGRSRGAGRDPEIRRKSFI
jgi:hypothetical protein